MSNRQPERSSAARASKPPMKEPVDFQNCAERLKALADPDRLRMVQCLFDGPLTVGEIATALREDIVKVSHHLAVLRRAGILRAQKEGRYVRYSIHPDVQIETLKASQGRQINLGCCQLDLLGK